MLEKCCWGVWFKHLHFKNSFRNMSAAIVPFSRKQKFFPSFSLVVISITMFFILFYFVFYFSFLVFVFALSRFVVLRIFISLLALPACPCMLPALSIRVFSILIMVVLDSSAPVIPGSDVCSVSSNCVFWLWYALYFFLIAEHVVLGKSYCCKEAVSNMMVRCRGREAFYIPLIRFQSFD